jgi:hypothetical protein
MSKAIERRLAVLERQTKLQGLGVQEIIIRGGLPGSGDPTFAGAGKMRWQRAADESFNAFRSRALAAATKAGERFLVIGGLQRRRGDKPH